VITGNCNFTHLFAFFFLILEKDFLFCIKKPKKIEKYEICVWLVIQTIPASSLWFQFFFVVSVISARRIGNYPASEGKIGNYPASKSKIGNYPALKGKMEDGWIWIFTSCKCVEMHHLLVCQCVICIKSGHSISDWNQLAHLYR